MQTHIYDEKLEKLISLNYTLTQFEEKPFECYPLWKSSYYATEIEYKHPKLVDGKLVEKTRVELVLDGVETLREGEKIVDNEIVYVPKPEGLKVEWIDFEWVETATEEELAEEDFRQAREFYNEELEFASKATAEFMCEIISANEYAGVKEYMQAIDPYAQAMKVARLSTPVRPRIFDKYN